MRVPLHRVVALVHPHHIIIHHHHADSELCLRARCLRSACSPFSSPFCFFFPKKRARPVATTESVSPSFSSFFFSATKRINRATTYAARSSCSSCPASCSGLTCSLYCMPHLSWNGKRYMAIVDATKSVCERGRGQRVPIYHTVHARDGRRFASCSHPKPKPPVDHFFVRVSGEHPALPIDKLRRVSLDRIRIRRALLLALLHSELALLLLRR